MSSPFQLADDEVDFYTEPDGSKGLADKRRGIGLVWLSHAPQRWTLVSMFTRTDTLQASTPFTMVYGKN